MRETLGMLVPIFNNKGPRGGVLSDNGGAILPVGEARQQIDRVAPGQSGPQQKKELNMSLRFIGTVVVVALAITVAGNRPARADNDLAKALLAIAGVAVVGKIISDRMEERNVRTTKSRTVSRANTTLDNPHWQDWDQWALNNSRRLEARPLPETVRRKLLPGDCLRSFDTSDGRLVVFGKKCLKENYAFNDTLPKDCAVKFRAFQKKRSGYDAKCLRQEGYQLARN